MSDADYLLERAQEEFKAASRSADSRVRDRHLELADAYAFRLQQLKRQEQLAQIAAL
jgi:hypothetical protein